MLELGTLEGFLQYHDMFVVKDVGLTLQEGVRLKPRPCLKEDQYEIHGNEVCQRAVELKGNYIPAQFMIAVALAAASFLPLSAASLAAASRKACSRKA